MNVKAMTVSVLVGTITMFAWQAVSNTALPWHTATMTEVADSTATSIATIRQLAPSNGVYFSKYGTLMAVRIAPDKADQTTMAAMGPMLMKQAALDLVVVTALCLLVGFLVDRTPLGVAKVAALGGFAMVAGQELSQSIWFGFTTAWAGVNVLDQTISFFLTGLVVGVVMQRLTRGDAVAVPDGQGYRTSGGRKTVSR